MDFTVLGIDLEKFMGYAPYVLLTAVGLNTVLTFATILMPKSPLLRMLKIISKLLWVGIMIGAFFFATELFQQVNDSLPSDDE